MNTALCRKAQRKILLCGNLNTGDYTYDLPPEKIAIYPLPERDMSKLLVYQNRLVTHSVFRSLPDHLPRNSFLFFNNTKVIPARLLFTKESGARIEIFLLNPVRPSPLLAETMVATGSCEWECTIGNLKRWPSDMPLKLDVAGVTLEAVLLDRHQGRVAFRWDGDVTFAALIHDAGETPLPPYLHRKADASDRERYQTIYSQLDGAVAAPTAGLHFTPAVFARLKENGIAHDFLTLHVSAGTFQPLKVENPDDHVMHEEQVIVTRANVENLLVPGRLITAVGTTSMRTLESLYWFGVRLIRDGDSDFRISQRDPYIPQPDVSAEVAIQAVADYMDRHRLGHIAGETSILIRPGYRFKVCGALITNFHQPSSTLILLVAAFVGEDWRRIYQEALTNDYRFLSYGDSSLLIPSQED